MISRKADRAGTSVDYMKESGQLCKAANAVGM